MCRRGAHRAPARAHRVAACCLLRAAIDTVYWTHSLHRSAAPAALLYAYTQHTHTHDPQETNTRTKGSMRFIIDVSIGRGGARTRTWMRTAARRTYLPLHMGAPRSDASSDQRRSTASGLRGGVRARVAAGLRASAWRAGREAVRRGAVLCGAVRSAAVRSALLPRAACGPTLPHPSPPLPPARARLRGAARMRVGARLQIAEGTAELETCIHPPIPTNI